jgi:hypothetical protein
MGKKLTVILGIHCHVANGSDASVFERVYKERIRPVLPALYKFPKFPAVLHFSGSLWYWIERNHNEILMMIADMIHRKQIELLSGGFYEPMMPLIGYNDRIGHIEMLTTYLRKHFGKRTHGCLLPEFAWDSSMPSVLASCNIAYTFLNEAYFLEAGLEYKDLCRPYISEDKGKVVTVFPVLSRLAREFEKNAGGTVDRLLNETEDGTERIVSIFPSFFSCDSDGTTEDSALSFLSELSDRESKINFSLPSRLIKNVSFLRKIYFPYRATKQFLIKYPETGHLYSKMVFVRALIDQLRGDKIRKRHAYEELWKAQDSCLYCGESCGINRTAVRKAAYQALLEAEKMTRRHNNGFAQSLGVFDFNFDGVNEYLFHGEDINCFISATGAGIFELDYLPCPWNYGVMAGVNGGRYLFRDTVAPPALTPARIRNEDYSGARLCGDERYNMTAIDRQHCRVSFKMPALTGGGNFSGIEIEKTYNFKKNEVNAAYRIANAGETEQDFIFMPELNMAFPGDDENSLRIYSYNEYRSFSEHSEKKTALPLGTGAKDLNVLDAAAVDFQDTNNEVIINLSADTVFDAWIFSETTAGGQDAPYEKNGYESTRIVIRKHLTLPPGAGTDIKFRLSFYHY